MLLRLFATPDGLAGGILTDAKLFPNLPLRPLAELPGRVDRDRTRPTPAVTAQHAVELGSGLESGKLLPSSLGLLDAGLSVPNNGAS